MPMLLVTRTIWIVLTVLLLPCITLAAAGVIPACCSHFDKLPGIVCFPCCLDVEVS